MKSCSAVTTWASRPIHSQAIDSFNAALDLIAEPLSLVEKKLCEQSKLFDAGIECYITDACGGSGKRLRPTLAFLAGGAAGELNPEHVQLALILELIHIASLVHDDIMDEAVLRRERPTLHSKWGNATSVLVGDLLFSHALKMATDFSNSDVCRRIADGTLDVCSGEILQTQRRFDVGLSLDEYYRIVQMKTGSLFCVACELGAVLSKAEPAVVEALKNYGNKIGIAYQILDDCIDLVGDQEKIGKTLGTDLQSGKFTLPVLMLLQSCSEKERAEWHHYLLNKEEKNSKEFSALLLERGALTAAVAVAQKLVEEAEVSISIIGKNPHSDGLRGIATYLRGVLETLSNSTEAV